MVWMVTFCKSSWSRAIQTLLRTLNGDIVSGEKKWPKMLFLQIFLFLFYQPIFWKFIWPMWPFWPVMQWLKFSRITASVNPYFEEVGQPDSKRGKVERRDPKRRGLEARNDFFFTKVAVGSIQELEELYTLTREELYVCQVRSWKDLYTLTKGSHKG